METRKLTLEWITGEDHVMLLLPAGLEIETAPLSENIGVLLGRKVAQHFGVKDSFTFEIMRSHDHLGVLIPMKLYAKLESHAARAKTSAQYVVSRCVVELAGSVVYDRRIEGDMGRA
jgi:hypothetical protein